MRISESTAVNVATVAAVVGLSTCVLMYTTLWMTLDETYRPTNFLPILSFPPCADDDVLLSQTYIDNDSYSQWNELHHRIVSRERRRGTTAELLDIDIITRASRNKSESFLYDFRPRLVDMWRKPLLWTVYVFDQVLTQNNITYFLYGSSLIGSYRHHGMIPWDDNADVMVSALEQAKLYCLLKSLEPKFMLSYYGYHHHFWRLSHFKGKNYYLNKQYTWPYLNIFFYEENDTHIWDVSRRWQHDFRYPKSVVFPLRRRPYHYMQLLAPGNPKEMLAVNYNVSECDSSIYDHKFALSRNRATVPCSRLHHVYPFVQRHAAHGMCFEENVYRGWIIGNFFAGNGCNSS